MEKDIFLNPILFSVPLNHFLLEKGITLQLKKKKKYKKQKTWFPFTKRIFVANLVGIDKNSNCEKFPLRLPMYDGKVDWAWASGSDAIKAQNKTCDTKKHNLMQTGR